MPNWIKNKLSFEGDMVDIITIMSEISTEEESIDFENIIPMPKSLRIDSSSSVDESLAVALYIDSGDDSEIKKRMSWMKNKSHHSIDDYIKSVVNNQSLEEFLKVGRIALQNIKDYGHKDWYTWALSNWGTKWNVSSTYLEDNEINFETAWSNPFPVILELSNKYPDVVVKLKFADEAIGSNCGEYHLKAGEVVFQKEYDEVEACILWGYDPSEMFEYVKRDNTIQEILKDDNDNSSLQ